MAYTIWRKKNLTPSTDLLKLLRFLMLQSTSKRKRKEMAKKNFKDVFNWLFAHDSCILEYKKECEKKIVDDDIDSESKLFEFFFTIAG